jgi:hypothetical protein
MMGQALSDRGDCSDTVEIDQELDWNAGDDEMWGRKECGGNEICGNI